jgi:hypothetical protein
MEQSHEPFALHSLEAAKRVMRAMDLDAANKAHSNGKLSNVEYSAVVQGLAQAAHPGDPKALSKYVEQNKLAFAAKARSDYERSQTYNVDDAHAHARATLAVGNGVGIGPRAAGGNTYGGTAASDDGVTGTLPSPTDNTIAAKSVMQQEIVADGKAMLAATYKRVHAQAVRDGYDSDQVWSALLRHERGQQGF